MKLLDKNMAREIPKFILQKLEFVKEDYSNIPQYFYLHHKK